MHIYVQILYINMHRQTGIAHQSIENLLRSFQFLIYNMYKAIIIRYNNIFNSIIRNIVVTSCKNNLKIP